MANSLQILGCTVSRLTRITTISFVLNWVVGASATETDYKLSMAAQQYNVASFCKHLGIKLKRKDIISASSSIITVSTSEIIFLVLDYNRKIKTELPEFYELIQQDYGNISDRTYEVISGYVIGYMSAVAEDSAEQLIKDRGVDRSLIQCKQFLAEPKFGFSIQ